MGTLIRTIAALSLAGYGVNIWEVPAPKTVSGVSANVVAMVADLPWGTIGEISTVTTPAEFFAAYYPKAFWTDGVPDYTTYPAILALLNKPLFTKSGLKVSRVDATGNVAGFKTDTAGTGTVTITAKCKGKLGNSIKREWTAGSDASHVNLIITIGTEYSATYSELTKTTLTSVDDTYVTVTDSSPSAVPSVSAATSLASGADGTATSGDYLGGDSDVQGLYLFKGDGVQADVIFVAECPSALCDAVNAGLKQFLVDTGKYCIVVLCTAPGITQADAKTYVDDNSVDDASAVFTWPQVDTMNFYAASPAAVQVDGNAFAAAAIANVDPWLSPGGAGKRVGTVDLLSGITDLEDGSASRTTLDLLNDAGVAPWFMSSALGAIMRLGCTTDGGRIWDRRIKNYLMASIAQFAENYVETQLDVDLTNQVLGPNTGAFIAAIQRFLLNEQAATHIQSYVVDAFSENTAESLAAGEWIVAISVKTYAMAERIVFKATIGTTVTIA